LNEEIGIPLQRIFGNYAVSKTKKEAMDGMYSDEDMILPSLPNTVRKNVTTQLLFLN
jgi:hypothetical protein